MTQEINMIYNIL